MKKGKWILFGGFIAFLMSWLVVSASAGELDYVSADGTVSFKIAVSGEENIESGTITTSATGKTMNIPFVGSVQTSNSSTITITNNSSYDIVMDGTISMTVASGEGAYFQIYTSRSNKGSEHTENYSERISLSRGSSISIELTSPKGKGNTATLTYTPTIQHIVTYDVTFLGNNYGTYTANGKAVSKNGTVTLTGVSNIVGAPITVTPDSEYTCIGFMDTETGELLDAVNSANETVFYPKKTCTVQPVYIPKTSINPFYVKGAYFPVWECAFAEVYAGGTVILAENYTLPLTQNTYYYDTSKGTLQQKYSEMSNGEITYIIPRGGLLLIPFDRSFSTSTEEYVYSGDGVATGPYCTLTLPDGANMRVTKGGTLMINAKVMGNGGKLEGVAVETYGKMVVGGTVDVYGSATVRGYMVDANHTSSVGSVNRTGKLVAHGGSDVHMLLQIVDYRGGNSTKSLYESVMPVNNFYFANIMLRAEYAGTSALYAQYMIATNENTGNITKSGEVLILGTTTNALFQQSSSTGTVMMDYEYSTDKMLIKLQDSSISMNDMSISFAVLLITYKMTTAGKQIPIGGGLQITVGSGTTFTCDKSLKLLPGASITIEEGATANITESIYLYSNEGFNPAWAYEGAYRKRLPVTGLVAKAGECVTEAEDAKIVVEGTLNVTGSMVQSNTGHSGGIVGLPGGKIQFDNVAESGSINEAANNAEKVTANTSWQAVTGLLAGVSASAADYRPFTTSGTGSYSATDVWASDTNAAWYQYTISVADGKKGITASSDAPTVGKTYTGSDTTVGYAVKGGTFAFSVDKGMVFTDGSKDYLAGDTNTITVNADTVLYRCVAGVMNGGSAEYFRTLKDAITAYNQPADGKYIQMVDDSSATNAFVAGTVLDLKGHKVTGVTTTGTIKGGDSSSDGYDKKPNGSITVSGNVSATANLNGKDYVAISTTENGMTTYQFWRFSIMPTACQFYFNPKGHSHLAYQATVRGHGDILKHLADISLSATDGTTTSVHSYKNENGGDLPAADREWVSCVLLDISETDYTTPFSVTATAAFDQDGTVCGSAPDLSFYGALKAYVAATDPAPDSNVKAFIEKNAPNALK